MVSILTERWRTPIDRNRLLVAMRSDKTGNLLSDFTAYAQYVMIYSIISGEWE